MEFQPISPIKAQGNGNLQLSQASYRHQLSMAKFFKGGTCKLQQSQVKFKLCELSPSSNIKYKM
jgi:hypothetical protein